MNITKAILGLNDERTLSTEELRLEVGCSYIGMLHFLHRKSLWHFGQRLGHKMTWSIPQLQRELRGEKEESIF